MASIAPDPRVADLADRYTNEATGYLETYSPELGPLTSRLIAMLAPHGARRILDLGAGPGSSVPAIRAAAPDARLVLADRAFGMIRLASPSVARVAADAMALPFLDASFDAVVSAFVVFHLPDPVAGFAEVARALAPGGRFGIATWSTEERLGSAWSVWDEELDAAGATPVRPHGLPHYQSLGTPRLLGPPLEQAGFTRITFETGWWRYRPTHAAFMAFMAKHAEAARFGTLDAARQRSCQRAVGERTEHLPATELGLDAGVLYAVAAR